MNKARGKKKDFTRILKAMKLQQKTTRYFDTVNYPEQCPNDYESSVDKKYIYDSITHKKLRNNNTKKPNLRYDKTSNESQLSTILPYRQQRSLQTRSKNNYMKINDKSKQHQSITVTKNPYLNTHKLRNSYQKPRRHFTQQSIRPEPLRKTLHLKTIDNSHTNLINSHQNPKQKNPQILNNFLIQAKLLSSNGSITQSQTIIQRILKQDPQNKQALYMSGSNNYKQMNYIKSLIAFNKLLDMDPMYNKNAYIMSSICFSKKDKKQQAMLRINTCLTYFPDYYDAHFQQAKLYLKQQDNQNAIKCLKKALKYTKDPYQCCIKLCQCYQKQQLYELALKLYDKMYDRILTESIKLNSKNKQEHHSEYLCLLKKAQCEKKLQKYQKYISTLQTYLKIIDHNSIINLAKIHYEIGYAYYKLNDFTNSIMNLQEVFQQKSIKQSTQALILLTVIYIKRRDFYEAYHCLARKQHLQIYQKQIKFYQKFCQGVLSLMKRKFNHGLDILIQLQTQIQQQLKSNKINQLRKQILIIYPMYIAYAYFCFGRADKCIKLYKKFLVQKQSELNIFRKGIQFNLALCQGLQQAKNKRLIQAKQYFQKSIEIYSNKPQGYLYLSVILIQLYLINFDQQLLKSAEISLQKCIQNLKQLNNNYAASVYYIKSALSAFMGSWQNSMNQIDQSIQRSQDNDSKAFYLRGLILACCQNFKQAINQVSIAISLNPKDPNYYLLRSKCTQIQGDGNKAFLDLQQYISLVPDDSEIHKYAGHLLFENGAFEDAVQAYENGQITLDISNYDVFLTRSKTYFLLGNFQNCISDMQKAYKLKPNDTSVGFDISLIKIINNFFKQQKNLLVQNAEKLKDELQSLAAQGQDYDYGRIFKKIQISMLISLFLFYMGKYKESARQFKQTISLKQTVIIPNESQYDQQQKQKYFFISQMNYNRALCYLMISENNAALKILRNSKIEGNTKTYMRLQKLINIIETQKNSSQFVEVFTQKNKMSRVLNQISIKINQNQNIKVKLCIPFPKVQPPQINPKFQLRILRQIDIQSIQRKPQAPWILRQQNSIKFTQKIQQFSRLQINNSQLSKADKQKFQNKVKDNNTKTKKQLYEFQLDSSQEQEQLNQSINSFRQLREKLKLDDKIQNKLNKILKNNK